MLSSRCTMCTPVHGFQVPLLCTFSAFIMIASRLAKCLKRYVWQSSNCVAIRIVGTDYSRNEPSLEFSHTIRYLRRILLTNEKDMAPTDPLLLTHSRHGSFRAELLSLTTLVMFFLWENLAPKASCAVPNKGRAEGWLKVLGWHPVWFMKYNHAIRQLKRIVAQPGALKHMLKLHLNKAN